MFCDVHHAGGDDKERRLVWGDVLGILSFNTLNTFPVQSTGHFVLSSHMYRRFYNKVASINGNSQNL